MENNCNAWGRSDQKVIFVTGADFSELQQHLKDGKWAIESVSACATGEAEFARIPNTYAYVVLSR